MGLTILGWGPRYFSVSRIKTKNFENSWPIARELCLCCFGFCYR
jgi:hypothetical protein